MNLNQHVFVTEYLNHRDKVLAYATAYNLKSTRDATTIESAANRLLRNPEVAEAIRKTYEAIRHEVEQQITKEMRTELLTLQRKREILAKIATGDIYVEQHYKGKNCSQCTQYIRPTINQMLKAIELDSKIAGHYPVKTSPGGSQPANREVDTTPAPEIKTVAIQTGEEPGDVAIIEVIAEADLEQLINPAVQNPGENPGFHNKSQQSGPGNNTSAG